MWGSDEFPWIAHTLFEWLDLIGMLILGVFVLRSEGYSFCADWKMPVLSKVAKEAKNGGLAHTICLA